MRLSERKSSYLSKAAAARGLLSIAQAQDELECSRSKVYALGRAGKLDLVKYDTKTMVTEISLRKHLNQTRPLAAKGEDDANHSD